MKTFKLTGILLLAAIIFLTAGCGFFSQTKLTEVEELAAIASIASDYRDQASAASAGKLEADDLKGKGISVSKTLFTYETERILPDGTVVTIVWILDDKDTPDDTEDDTLEVTRTYDIWGGLTKIEKIARPVKPEAEWTGWIDNQIVQEGECEEFIDGIKTASGTITATWKLEDSDVVLTKIEKEINRLDRNGIIVRTVIEIDENGLQNKTQYRIRITAGEEIIVNQLTFEEFIDPDDGKTYTKIIRDDGNYAIIRNERDPRVTEFYTENDILMAVVTETRDQDTGDLTVVKEFYDENGTLIDTREVIISYRFLGDEVLITKTFDDGHEVIIRIQENDNGYTVTRNNFTYSVVFIDNGVEIYNGDGSLIATVTFNDDGTWTVAYPDGSQSDVEM